MKILVFTPFSKSGHLDGWREKICQTIAISGNHVVDLNPTNFFPLEYFQSANFDSLATEAESKGGLTENCDQEVTVEENEGFRHGLTRATDMLRRLFPDFIWRQIRPLRRFVLDGLVLISKYFPGKKVKAITSDEKPLTLNDVYKQIKLTLLIERDVDLIFVTYFDGLSDSTLKSWSKLEKLLDTKISVIVFKVTPRIERALVSSQSISSIGTVDLPNFNKLVSLQNRIDVTLLPDFPSVNSLGARIDSAEQKLFCDSNPVIGMIGSIDSRKNLDLFFDCATSVEGSNYNWLVVGKIYFEKLGVGARTIVRINESLSGKYKNIVVIPDFQSNSDYEHLFNLIDIHFLMYINWNSASNGVTNVLKNNKIAILNADSPYFDSLVKMGLGIGTISTKESVFDSAKKARTFRVSEDSRAKYLMENSEEMFQDKLMSLIGLKNHV